jgi:membrane dipeptidase
MSTAARILCVLMIAAGLAATPEGQVETELVKKARAIHNKVIALDAHVDISSASFAGAAQNYTQRLDTQVNLPKMLEGGLDAAFFVVYVGQPNPATTPDAFEPSGYDRAYKAAIEKFDAIHKLTRDIAPDKIELALTAADVRRINGEGKKVALIGVENGYPLGTDISRVKEFYDRGARYMSLAHNGHSQLSDSNTGETDGWKWNGLSPLGKQVIAEMNRVGIMIDVSHPSKGSMMQTLQITKAPIIASHSSARARRNHSRNLDDEQLLALKKNGGVVQTVAFANYVKSTETPERTKALDELRKDFGLPAGATLGGRGGRGRGGQGRDRGQSALAELSEERRAELDKRVAEVNAKYPPLPRATVRDFVDHIDYIVKKIGIDHVGISSDFDGGGGVDGWSDASETFNVTLELFRRGYTEAQIAKIWSGNLLRVMEQVAKVAAVESRKKQDGRSTPRPIQNIRGVSSGGGFGAPAASGPASISATSAPMTAGASSARSYCGIRVSSWP